MNKKLLVVVGGLALVGGGALFLSRGAFKGADAVDGPVSQPKGRLSDAVRPQAVAKRVRPARLADAGRIEADAAEGSGQTAAEESAGEAGLSAEDQKLVDAVQSALDDENFDEVKRLAEKLLNHPVAEVRRRAVEALQWFGGKALESLTPFLADSDEDTATAAMNAVEQSLMEMDDEKGKINYIESLFQIRNACDADALAMLSGQLKGFSDEAAVVSSALRVIESGQNPDAVREMKEVYEFVTGEPYTTSDAAQQWILENSGENP